MSKVAGQQQSRAEESDENVEDEEQVRPHTLADKQDVRSASNVKSKPESMVAEEEPLFIGGHDHS